MTIHPDLLEILVCPTCLVPVRPAGAAGLECGECGRFYPVRDGVPVLLGERALSPGSRQSE